MQRFTHDDTDADILHDLLEEINELYEASEQTLIELEINPQDNDLQRSLFRSVHTIKGDLGLVGFTPLYPLMQHIEDLLDYLRKGQMTYTSNMSDVVLQGLDRVKHFVRDCIGEGSVEYDAEFFTKVVDVLKEIKPDSDEQNQAILVNAAKMFGGDMSGSETVTIDSLNQNTLTRSGIPKDLAPDLKADMLFFRELMQPIEKRVLALQGRGDRMAQMAHLINTHAGSIIPTEQLSLACYVHDFGMAFMPLSLVNAETRSAQEEKLLHSHVYKSARLLEHLSVWDGARKIVMEHHERCDGSGYPFGLAGDAICAGAKLLAILDTYYDLHHAALGQEHELPAQKKALVAVNKNYMGQLCPFWLEHFNQTIARVLAH